MSNLNEENPVNSGSHSIMKLVFNHLNSPTQGRSGWICCIPGFDSNYCIWFDGSKDKYIVSDLKFGRTEHTSLEASMAYCQKDFEERVNGLFEDTRFGNWKLKENIHGKLSNETAFDIWNAFDEEDK